MSDPRRRWHITPDTVADIVTGLEAGFGGDPAAPTIAVVGGEGAKVAVERGHLVASDGVGPHRRERRWNRATHELDRLIIAAGSGYVTIDALVWCRAAGVAVIVVDDTGTPTLTTIGSGTDDARVRRAQAQAHATGLAGEGAAMLLTAKLAGQAAVATGLLDRVDVAATIDALTDAMGGTVDVDELRQLEASAAAVYFDAWHHHPATTLRFARRDVDRVPGHWPTFEGRRSLLTGGVTPRRAERPLNAMLNLCYRLAGIEARLAATAVGLDPGLGFVHADTRNGNGLTFDLIEPVRPAVDRFVLDVVAERTFTRADFVERSDGSIRLAPRLAQELAATMGMWARLVAPHAEAVAHLVGRAVNGRWEPTTPLTGANQRAAKALDRARRQSARSASRAGEGGRRQARRRNPAQAALAFGGCVDCGAPLTRPRHLRCEACWELIPGQGRDTRRRRGQAIAAAAAGLADWRNDHPGASRPPPEAFAPIRDALTGVPLAAIRNATGLSKSMASQSRSGRTVPHMRHWAALAQLADEYTAGDAT